MDIKLRTRLDREESRPKELERDILIMDSDLFWVW